MKICFFNFLCIIPSAITHTLSPSCLICSLLHLQPNSLYTLFNLSSPCVLRLSLPICFKHQSLLFNVDIIPLSHMCISPYSICYCHLANISFKPSISFTFSSFLPSTNFTPHFDITMALCVLKIVVSFALKNHVSLPYNVADLPQLRYAILFVFRDTFQVIALRIL